MFFYIKHSEFFVYILYVSLHLNLLFGEIDFSASGNWPIGKNSVCTYSCVANNRLIFATCSLSSMSLSPWSPLSFLLVGLMGGGPVLWLETEDEEEDNDEDEEEEDEDRDREWSLGSALKAASPVREDRGAKKGQNCEEKFKHALRKMITFNQVVSMKVPTCL